MELCSPPPSSMAIVLPLPSQESRLPISLVMSRLANTPTLLPDNLAKLITAISLAARVSIRASALFIEAILESARYSTITGLGLTRRALISAVGSARTLHYVNQKLDWSGKNENGETSDDAFLQVLDKYTNLGIYLIHHTFTLAELFAMSGFYLTMTTIQTGLNAAEESVRMFDGILGSNETSRALSSIITLVRSELTQDPRYSLAERGAIASLTALTKALTAFACLQTATHKRTLRQMKLRVMYDCTVVVSGETERMISPGNLNVSMTTPVKNGGAKGGGDLHMKSTGTALISPRATGADVSTTTRSRTNSVDLIMTDIRGELNHHSRSSISSPRRNLQAATLNGTISEETTEAAHIVEELGQLFGSSHHGDEGEERMDSSGEKLPEAVQRALEEVQRGDGKGHMRTILATDHEYEIEVHETMTTTTTTVRTRERSNESAPRTISRQIQRRTRPLSFISVPTPPNQSGSSDIDDPFGAESVVQENVQECEWMEVSTIYRGDSRGPSFEDGMVSRDDSSTHNSDRTILSAENGRTPQSFASFARQDAVDRPEKNSERLRVVLRTMTKKFTETRRTTTQRLPRSMRTRSSSPDQSVLGSTSQSPHSVTISQTRIHTPPAQSTRSSSKTRSALRALGSAIRKKSSSYTLGGGGNARRSSHEGSTDSSRANSPPPPVPTLPPLEFQSDQLVLASSIPRARKVPRLSTAQEDVNATISAPSARQRLHARPVTNSGAETEVVDSSRRNSAKLSPLISLGRGPTSTRSMQSIHTTCTQTESGVMAAASGKGSSSNVTHFPNQHLVRNLQRFMRYSSAAYGQVFLRILGIGKHDFNFPHTQETHANNHAFAHHVGVQVSDILLSSFHDNTANLGFSTAKMSPIVNYVVVDHSISAVVLSCRGSLGLSDILTDLTCSYEAVTVEHGDPTESYFVHSGIYCSATLLQRGTVHDTIRDALKKYPSYGLALCGHSLGGGVAALLSVLWSSPTELFKAAASEHRTRTGQNLIHPPLTTAFVTSTTSGLPPGRPIACYAFGPPCIASPDLVRYCRGLVTSTIHNYDIVPTLSLGVLRDLKNMAMGLYSENGVAEEIVGRVIGLYQRKFMAARNRKKGEKQMMHSNDSKPSTTEKNMDMDTDTEQDLHEAKGKWDADAVEHDSPVFPSSPTDAPNEAREVPLTVAEVSAGKGSNKALESSYCDPSLLGPDDVSEDVELNDWLWSLVKTMRAGNDSEKLYPPGEVYLMENYTVFISTETDPDIRNNLSSSRRQRYARQEGRRIILRAVDDVEARFSEPLFGRTMMSDHSPLAYEQNVDWLAEAVLP